MAHDTPTIAAGSTAGSRPGPFARLLLLRHRNRTLWTAMLISSILSLVASFVLSVDAYVLAADPGATLACDLSSAVSCGAVAQAWQASVFGFPNSFLGLMAEPVIIAIAVAALGGVRFPRWFMAAAWGVYLLGLVFAYWLFFQSMFVIGALCPWCLLVTVSTTAVFVSFTHINVRDDNLYLPRRVQAWLRAQFDADVDLALIAGWFVLLAIGIVYQYGAELWT